MMKRPALQIEFLTVAYYNSYFSSVVDEINI